MPTFDIILNTKYLKVLETSYTTQGHILDKRSPRP